MQTNLPDPIANTIADMISAWDAGEATAYARLFTTDATYVTFTGAVSSGRDAIAHDHEPVLQRFQKGSRMRVRVLDTRFVLDDVAVVVSDGGIGKRSRVPLDKLQTFVFERQGDGRWLCAAFQNSKKNRLLNWVFTRSTRSR